MAFEPLHYSVLRLLRNYPDGMTYPQLYALYRAWEDEAKDRLFHVVYELASMDPPLVDIAGGVIRLTSEGRDGAKTFSSGLQQ